MQEQPEPPDDLLELSQSIDDNYATLAASTTHVLQQLQGIESTGSKSSRKSNQSARWEDGVTFVWKNVADPPASDIVYLREGHTRAT